MQELRPTVTSELNSITEVEQEADFEKTTEEEDSLAFVGRSEGWKRLTQYMSEIETELDQMVVEAIASGLSLEEVGKRTIVKELTKDAIRKVKSKVDDAREASDRRRS